MFEFITKRSIFFNILSGFFLMVICLFLLYILLGPITRHGKIITVPNVIGKNFEEAKKILSNQGFDVEIQDSIYTDTTSTNAVLKQMPEGDAIVKIHRKVYLTINRSVPPFVEMPNLIGFSFRNAEMQLRNLGLRVGDTVFKPDFARNAVLEQLQNGLKIKPGDKIQQGSIVVLVVGDGLGGEVFNVPNLLGRTFSDAKEFLESNGLSFLVVLPDVDVKDTSTAFIYKQNPAQVDEEGNVRKIRQGQTIDVWLSVQRPRIDTLHF